MKDWRMKTKNLVWRKPHQPKSSLVTRTWWRSDFGRSRRLTDVVKQQCNLAISLPLATTALWRSLISAPLGGWPASAMASALLPGRCNTWRRKLSITDIEDTENQPISGRSVSHTRADGWEGMSSEMARGKNDRIKKNASQKYKEKNRPAFN